MIRELSMNAAAGLAGATQTQFASPGVGGRSSPMQLDGYNPGESAASDAVKVSLSQTSEVYSDEAGKKEQVNAAAIQGRSAKEQLDRAGEVLDAMSAQLGMVKNYPPFPPGNDERVKFLNSLEALKKQLQSLEIPPVSNQFKPVFYPREDVFPPLDAKVPSDAAVLAFGDAVLSVKNTLASARDALEAQLNKVAEKAGYFAALNEGEASDVSQTVAVQVQGKAMPLAGNTDIYTQI